MSEIGCDRLTFAVALSTAPLNSVVVVASTGVSVMLGFAVSSSVSAFAASVGVAVVSASSVAAGVTVTTASSFSSGCSSDDVCSSLFSGSGVTVS